MGKKGNTRGLRGIGIRKVVPNQINFNQAISGSLALTQITTPSSVPDGLGQIYFKSDGKLYFKSDKFEETDLLAGSNGLSFLFTTSVLTIESDANYGDTDEDGGDWPANFSNGPSAKVDASVPGIPTFTTTGHDFTNTNSGGNPGENTYRIDASRASATTDNGTDLTVALSGHNDGSPTNFSIDLSNGSKSVLKLNVTLDSSNNTKITLNNLSQYENAANDQTFSSVVVNIPFKVNIAGTITTVTRTITVQKIRTGLEGTTSRTVNLTATKIAFEYDQNGNKIGTPSSTITATALNTTGQVYFQFLIDGVQEGSVIAGSVVNGNYTAQLVYDGTDVPALFTNMPQVIECRIREVTGTAAGTILARDQIGMLGVKEGSGAYQVYMENSAHVVPATRGGDGSGDATTLDMTNSNPGFIAVFKGATRLTLVTTGTPTTGQFKVTSVTQSPASNAGGISTVDQSAAVQNDGGPGNGKDAIFGDHGDMGTANTGIVTYTINCENTETLSVIQTVTKSIQGTRGQSGPGGSNARAVEFTVTSNTPVIEFDDLGAVEAGVTHASVELTATTRNTTGTMTFVYEIDDVEITNSNKGNHSFSNNVFTYSTTGKTYNDFPERIEVIAKEDGSEVARDQITLIAIKPGSGAYKISMPNDNTTVTSTEANDGAGDANIDYSSTSDTIRLFKGNVQLEPIIGGSGTTVIGTTNTPTAGQFSVISQTVTNGTVTRPTLTLDDSDSNDKHIDASVMSGLTSDIANITYVFNCEGLAQESRTVTVAKSKQGVNGTPGETGLGVDLEIEPPVVIYNDLGTTPDVSSVDIVATTRNLGTEIARSAFFNHSSANAFRTNGNGGLGISAMSTFAIGFWIKFPSNETFPAGNRYICYSTELRIHITGTTLALNFHTSGVNRQAIQSSFWNTSDAGKWVHVLFQRTGNIIYIYKNGSQFATKSHGGGNIAMDALNSTFYLGNDNNSGNPIGAELSNFVIWNTFGGNTLAQQQYNSGKVLTSPIANGITYRSNVQVWYKLDEDQGTSSATTATIIDHKNSKNLTALTQLESVSNPGLFSKSGPSYFTFKVGGTVVGSANQTLNHATYTVPTTFDSFKGDPKSVIVELKRDSPDVSVEAIDQGVITAIKPGPGAPSVILNNPFHYFNGVDGTGTVSSFTGTGTQIQVIKNGEYLTAVAHDASPGAGQFRVSAVNTPSVGVVPPEVDTYTLSDTETSGHNDTVTVGNMTAHGSNVFSKANGQFTEVLYTVNIEGTDNASTVIARQRFIVQTSGADGNPGLNAGLVVNIDPPLAVVQTDRYGTPLTNALDVTETVITVADTTTASDTLLDATDVAIDHPDRSNNTYNVIGANATLTTTETNNYSYPGGSLTITSGQNRSGANVDSTKIEKLATMTTNAVVRVFDIQVKNSNGDDFRLQAVQQIVKAVANVETLTPQIGKPIVQFVRTNYQTYTPEISDYSDGATFIKLWKQTGVNDPVLVQPAVSSDNTTTALADNLMPNDTYKILEEETGNTLFPIINVSRGQLTYRTGAQARVEVGAPSNYLNSSFPAPLVISYKIKYKDTAGNFHFIPLTQTALVSDSTPPEFTFQIRSHSRLNDEDSRSLLDDVQTPGSTSFNDTHVILQRSPGNFSAAVAGFHQPIGDFKQPIGTVSTHEIDDIVQNNLGDIFRNGSTRDLGELYQSNKKRFQDFDSLTNTVSQRFQRADGTKYSSASDINEAFVRASFWYPGRLVRLTGAAAGQVRFRSMSWTGTQHNNQKQFKFGLDLYKFNMSGYLSNNNGDINPTYLGSFKFGTNSTVDGDLGDPSGTNSNHGSYFHVDCSSGGSNRTRSIVGMERYSGDTDPSIDTSNAMIVTALESLMFVMYFDRKGTFPSDYNFGVKSDGTDLDRGAVPQSGEIRVIVDFNYYLL